MPHPEGPSAAPRDPRPPRARRFGRAQRLSLARDFDALRRGALRVGSGPLTLALRASPTGKMRLGLAVPARVGTNVKRNRVKRLLREAFRVGRASWEERGWRCDVLVLVRPHAQLTLEGYRSLLHELLERGAGRAMKTGAAS